MARALSGDLLGTSLEAVYHTGVVAFGKEYWFGCGLQCAAESTTQTQFGMPLRSVDMGTTEIDESMFEEFLTEVSSRFTPETYNLLRWNCNHFSDEATQFLVGKSIPQEILDLPEVFMRTEIGKSLAPMLGAFENRMRHTQGDAAVPTTARAAEEAPPKAAGLPALKPRAAKKSTSTDTETNIATPSSASASSEDIAHMVRSISQVFAEQKQNGESTQRATSAALHAAKDALLESQRREP